MIVMGMALTCDSFVKVIYFKKKNLLPQKASGHSVHWGINPPLKNNTHLFFIKPSPKSPNCPSPPFRGFPGTYSFFVTPLKNRILQWTPILKFFILNSSHLSKITKFSVKISQFKFNSYEKGKHFCLYTFLSLNISDFRF